MAGDKAARSRRAAAAMPPAQPDSRFLSSKEMQHAIGRGKYRNEYLCGTAPWHRTFRDVNLCTGNLAKSYTDIQVAAGRGAGLVMNRSYNSDDGRVGPFGVGWQHAYDIRMQEDSVLQADSGGDPSTADINGVPRADFFGGKHSYHRDADGLYSSPTGFYDKALSTYSTAPTLQVQSDTVTGTDGTIKHYSNIVTNADGTPGNDRYCDWIQDRHGNTTTLTYGQTIPLAGGGTKKLLTAVTDPTNRSLQFTWSNLGSFALPVWRITQVQGPFDNGELVPGVTYRVTYDYYTDATSANAANELYNLKAVHLDPDNLNRTTTYTYTGISQTASDGTVSSENGLLASIIDPLGHVISYTYTLGYSGNVFSSMGVLSAITPCSTLTGTVWVYQVTEAAGVDAQGNPRTDTWSILFANGVYATSMMVTNDRVNLPSNAVADATFYSSINIAYVVDQYLRFEGMINNKTAQQNTSDAAPSWFFNYDSSNNVTSHGPVSITDNNCGSFGPISAYSYDNHGNVVARQYTNGPSRYGTIEATEYYDADKNFQTKSFTDMAGNVSSCDYYSDSDTNTGNRGNPMWSRDALYSITGAQHSYTYNQYGQKLSETNENGVTTDYIYGNNWGNLTQVIQDAGDTSAGHLNRTTTMTYDAAGHVLSKTDPNGKTATMTYNVLGQVVDVNVPPKGSVLAETIAYSYDADGRMLLVTDHRGSTSITYEPGCDRIHSVTDPETGTLTYTYTLTGERQTVSIGSSRTITFGYRLAFDQYSMPSDKPDDVGLTLDSVSDTQGRTVYFAIDAINRIHQVVAYDPLSHNYVLQTEYLQDCEAQESTNEPYLVDVGSSGVANYENPTCGLQSVTMYANGGTRPLSANNYTYDVLGNRTSNCITDQNGNNRKENYTYDPLSRLKTVDYGDGETQRYSFDNLGNRLEKDDAGGSAPVELSTFDAVNRILSRGSQSIVSDANGNILSDGTHTNVWDAQNRLISCTANGVTSTYDYSVDGLRHSSTTNGVTTYYVYDGQNCIGEMQAGSNGTLSLSASYLIGARGPECRIDETNQTETYTDPTTQQTMTRGLTSWYVYDGLGSVVGTAQGMPGAYVQGAANGGKVQYTPGPKRDVYGSPRTSGTLPTPHGFVGSLGHPTDPTGLMYMRARYYDPECGRFISEDPGLNGVNWYVYCSANPVIKVDQTGKDELQEDGIDAALYYKANRGKIFSDAENQKFINAIWNFLRAWDENGAGTGEYEQMTNQLDEIIGKAVHDIKGGVDIKGRSTLFNKGTGDVFTMYNNTINVLGNILDHM